MSAASEDFNLGASALVGRAIGEVNGLQRRVDVLEREIFLLQERVDRKPSRGEFALYVFALLAMTMMVGGGFVVTALWYLGRLKFWVHLARGQARDVHRAQQRDRVSARSSRSTSRLRTRMRSCWAVSTPEIGSARNFAASAIWERPWEISWQVSDGFRARSAKRRVPLA